MTMLDDLLILTKSQLASLTVCTLQRAILKNTSVSAGKCLDTCH
jgi:hypothetical protein